jgi:hypothetical protein
MRAAMVAATVDIDGPQVGILAVRAGLTLLIHCVCVCIRVGCRRIEPVRPAARILSGTGLIGSRPFRRPPISQSINLVNHSRTHLTSARRRPTPVVCPLARPLDGPRPGFCLQHFFASRDGRLTTTISGRGPQRAYASSHLASWVQPAAAGRVESREPSYFLPQDYWRSSRRPTGDIPVNWGREKRLARSSPPGACNGQHWPETNVYKSPCRASSPLAL